MQKDKNTRSAIKTRCLFAFLICGSLLRAQSLKLESCYELAKKNYPLIKQYALIDKSFEFTISNANKAYFPQFSLTGIGAYIFGGLPSFSMPGAAAEEESNFKFIGIGQINQVLWDGGATKSHKEIIQASAEIEKANLDVSLYLLRERVNQLYFGILLIDEQLTQLNLQQDLLNTNVKKVQTYKDNGLTYSTDVDELKAEVLRTEQKKIEFKYSRQAYVTMLSYMINQTLDENSTLEIPADKTISSSEINRPERTVFSNQKKALSAQSSTDKVNLMPKLGLLASGVMFAPGINIGSSEFKGVGVAGLSLSWNSAGLYRNKNNKDLYKINLQKIEAQEEQFLFNTKLQLKQSQGEVDKKLAILQKDEEIVSLRTTIRNNYQKKYDNGLCSLLDIITATEKESEAKASKALHHVEWLLSSYQYFTINGN